MESMNKTFLLVMSVVLCSALSVTSTLADNTWVGDTSSDYNDATNWDSDPNPPSGNLYINGAGATPVVSSTPSWSTVDIIVGDDGTGRLDQNAGTLSTGGGNWAVIGRGDGNSGTYNLSGGNFNTARLLVGDNVGTAGSGTVTIDTSGTVSTTYSDSGAWFQDSSIVVGVGSNTTNSTLNLQNGTVSGVNVWVGAWGGEGTWNQTGGTANISGIFAVGNYQDTQPSATDGTATIANGTLNAGAVTIARARVNEGPADNVNGSMIVNSGGIVNSEFDFIVGEQGLSGTSASLTINNGGEVNVGSSTYRWMMVARDGDGDASLTVNSGGTLNLNAGSDLRLHQDGNSGTQSVLVDGGTIQGTGGFLKGGNATSTITIQNGGQVLGFGNGHDTWDGKTTVTSGGVLETLYVAGASGVAGSGLYLDDGTVRATAGGTGFINYFGGASEAYVSAGGATIDNNSFDVEISTGGGADNGLLEDPSSTGGGVTFKGSGKTTLGQASTYTGPTVVENGILSLSASGSIDDSESISIAAGATLDVDRGGSGYTFAGNVLGNGTITGDLTLASSSTIAPGLSVGTLTADDNLTLEGTYQVEFDDNLGSPIDLLAVLGTLTLNGATVDFADISPGTDGLAGESYVFATYGTLAGDPQFTTVNNLPDNYTIEYAFDVGGGNFGIALVAVPEASSFLAMGLVTGIVTCRLSRRRRRAEQAA